MKNIKLKSVLPIIITASMLTSSFNNFNINNNFANFANASEEKINSGLNIEKPYVENEVIKFNINSTKSGSLFDNYWSKVDKVLIDGKDFGFNNQGTYSDEYYTLFDGVVTVNAKNAFSHYSKQQKHKIEFIFTDKSSAIYEDTGYVAPTNTNEETTNSEQQSDIYKIKELKIDTNWKNEKLLLIELTESSKHQQFFDNISELTINDTKLTDEQLKSADISPYFGIRFYDNAIVSLMKEDNNKIKIKFKDNSILNYPKEDNAVIPNPPTDNNNNNENVVLANKTILTGVEKKTAYKELAFNIDSNYVAQDVFKNLKSITINGKEYPKSHFAINWSGQIYSLGITPSTEIFNNWDENKKNVVVLNFNDDTVSAEHIYGSDKVEKTTFTLTDKLEDGEYTLGFNALYADGRTGTSMLEGFFDKNIKLEVKNGEMQITMLNLLFAYSLYDLAIENDGVMTSTKKEFFGTQNTAGQYDRALFTSKINKLEDIHLAGVIVGHMGGLQSQIGDFSKYTKVKLKFKPEIQKGWTDFNVIEEEKQEKEKSASLLNKKLIANGVDADKDGIVTAEELQKFKGAINIGSILINDAIDKGSIYNIELLKNMGPGVTSFSSDSNVLGELPEDLFSNAINIETINLGGNKITKIPENLFKNNKKLTTLNLSANNLVTLPENLFINNTKLEEISINQAWLNSLPQNIFKNNINLKQLGLSSNKLNNLDNNIFNNNKNLEFISIDDNELTNLPNSLGNISSLTSIYAANNKINSIPETFSQLEKINKLHLNNNNISQLPNKLWESLAKNNARVYLVGNQLNNIPLETIRQNGKLANLDIANNNLPKDIPYSKEEQAILGLYPESTQAYYPQRTAVNLNAVAENQNIIVEPENNMTILNLFHWYQGRSKFFGGEGIIQGSEKYSEFIKNLTMPMDELLKSKDYNRNWQINTKIERIRNNNSTEIYNNTIANENDKKIEITDNNMMQGDIYKITKTLYQNTPSQAAIKIVSLTKTITANVKTTNNTDIKPINNKEKYSVNVRLKQASSNNDSMGNGALNSIAEVEKDSNGLGIILTFKPLYIDAFKATGNVIKIGHYPTLDDMRNNRNLRNVEVLETYPNGNPKKIKIHISSEEKQVGIRVWVDMMEEIARQSGQKDGSQPAVLEFNWDNKASDSNTNNNYNTNDNNSNNLPIINNTTTNTTNKEKYNVKVRLKHASLDKNSMGNDALNSIAEVEKDSNGLGITLTFKPLYIEAFKATGNVIKIGHYPTLDDMRNNRNLRNVEVLETYENGNPKKIKIHISNEEKQVGIRVWVDMMEEIARQSGQKDGSQPAILEFDWDNKVINSNTNNNNQNNDKINDNNLKDNINNSNPQNKVLPNTGINTTSSISILALLLISIAILNRKKIKK